MTCTGVDGGLNNLNSTVHPGQHRLTFASCSGLSNAEHAPIEYNGGTFTVTPKPVTATVIGFQGYGSSTPHFTATLEPSDLDLGNDVTCDTANGGVPISSDLHVDGSYTLDGASCSGLFDIGGLYDIHYVGGEFRVLPVPVEVTATGSQIFGGQPNFAYTTTPAKVTLNGRLICTRVGNGEITPTMPPNTYGQLNGCSGLSSAHGDYQIQFTGGDVSTFTVNGIRW